MFQQDEFYSLKKARLKDIKDILIWADKHGRITEVTMLDIKVSCGRVKSDKDFDAVLKLITSKLKIFFVIILCKKMNLYGRLYNTRVIRDMLEIAVRGIDVDSKEYFIMIWMEKKHLPILMKKYDIKRSGT